MGSVGMGRGPTPEDGPAPEARLKAGESGEDEEGTSDECRADDTRIEDEGPESGLLDKTEVCLGLAPLLTLFGSTEDDGRPSMIP